MIYHKTSANQGAEKVEENSFICLSSILAYKVLTCKACVGKRVVLWQCSVCTFTLTQSFSAASIDLTTWQMPDTKAQQTRSDLPSLSCCTSPPPPPPALLHSLGSPSIPSSLHLPFWTRDEAEMEYLKIAQDLDMYGVNYFLIRVSPCCFSTVCSVYKYASMRVTDSPFSYIFFWAQVQE